MKARYSYPLLFLLPGAMLALLVAFIVVGAGAGVMWIFIYGDTSWPESAKTALMVLAMTASAATWFALIALGYSFGKNREARGGLCRSHVILAVVISVFLPLLALFHQWQVGNIGSRSVVPVDGSFKSTPLR